LRDLRLFRKAALEKRKVTLQAAGAPGPAQSMWCADYTLDMIHDVDTIEVKGAPDQIIIQPGGWASLVDRRGSVGRLARAMGTSPAQLDLAWALLPGWQKWRPTYRVGVIHDINTDTNTASVTLDAAASVAQNLEINQAVELTGVNVEYMTCDTHAFEEGDRVVVEFMGQTMDDPWVIGFESHPKPCTRIVPAFFAHDIYGDFVGFLACANDGNIWGDPYQFIPFDYTAHMDAPEWLHVGVKDNTKFKWYLSGLDTKILVNGSTYNEAEYPPYYLSGQRNFVFQPEEDGPIYYAGFVELQKWEGDNFTSDYRYAIFCEDESIDMTQYNDSNATFETDEGGPMYHEVGGYRAYMFSQYYIKDHTGVDRYSGGVALVDLAKVPTE